MYDHMFTIDYQQLILTKAPIVDLSFTYMNWMVIEQIYSGNLSIDHCNPSLIESTLYNIMPSGWTILHYLSTNREDELIKLLKIAHPNEENIKEVRYHMPLLPNLKEKSPLHLAIETKKSDSKSSDKDVLGRIE